MYTYEEIIITGPKIADFLEALVNIDVAVIIPYITNHCSWSVLEVSGMSHTEIESGLREFSFEILKHVYRNLFYKM
jgi:hypothetical protein